MTLVYALPDTNSTKIAILLKGKTLRVEEHNSLFYKFKYGVKIRYLKKTDLLAGDVLTAYVKQHPSLFDKQATMEKESNIYERMSTKDKKVATAAKGEVFLVKAVMGDWVKVSFDGNAGYVKRKNVSLVSFVQITNYETVIPTGTKSNQMVKYAKKFLGNPYVWGGESLTSGTDCSGFVREIYKAFGIQLSRCSYTQVEEGKEVSFSQMKQGDLIFYMRGSRVGHVAMYIGNGKIIHARGRAYGICINDYDYSTPYQVRRYL